MCMCICRYAYIGMIRLYVTLADIPLTLSLSLAYTVRPATSDRPVTSDRPPRPTNEAMKRISDRPDRGQTPRPYRTVLYGAQSHRRSHARNPTLATAHAPLRFTLASRGLCCATLALAHGVSRLHFVLARLGFSLSLPRFRPLDAPLALFCALCKLTSYKK